MAARWIRSKWVLAFGIMFGVCFIYPFFYPFGRPTTPMTLKAAKQQFAVVSVAGKSQDAVQAWLSSQGILWDVLERREDTTFKGWWMDCLGRQTVAECAGLNVDDVHSVVRVRYPDASRYFLGQTEITVYFFFDAKGLLLRQWASEFNMGL
jgi:hypothetical protein